MNWWQKYKLRKLLKRVDSGPIVFLTGAGISAESGIKTFRDSDGLWQNEKIEEVCRPEGFKKDPLKVLNFYNDRRKDVLEAIPNLAHYLISELQAQEKEVYIITQNIDNLHEIAGGKNIFHIHGDLFKDKCNNCKKIVYNENNIELPNKCSDCGAENQMRPDVVFFKETPYLMQEAEALARNAKIFIVIGTSGQVYPAAGLIKLAARCDALVIEINPNPSGNKYIDFVIKEKASKGLLALVELLLKS